MKENNSNSIGLGGLLGVLFVGLKLGGVIAWSWWWVLCPFWIGIPIVIIILIFAGLAALIAS